MKNYNTNIKITIKIIIVKITDNIIMGIIVFPFVNIHFIIFFKSKFIYLIFKK